MDKQYCKNIEECAGIALINKGRIFLIRPLFNGCPQNYAIPKGHIEEGEPPEEAARREFKEETGIDVSDKELTFLMTVSVRINKNTIKNVHVFKAYGNGNERFLHANLRENGFPENIYGEYIPFKNARLLITQFQVPIIDKLLKDGLDSFETYYKYTL